VTAGYSTAAKLWSAESGKLVRTLDCRSSPSGLRPVFSPDGRTIAIGDRNSHTIVFDVATGKRLLTLSVPETQELAFHPSGLSLAVAYANGSLRLWETATGELLAEHEQVAEEIYTLDWSPDGKLLASAGLNGDICLWDEQLRPLHALPAPEWVISVKFSPDGTRLMTAGGAFSDRTERTVTVWGVPPFAGRLPRGP
jgi:WD40 repeat protein